MQNCNSINTCIELNLFPVSIVKHDILVTSGFPLEKYMLVVITARCVLNILYIGVLLLLPLPLPPQKHHSLLNIPLKSTNCPRPPFLGSSPLYIVFFVNPPSPWKSDFSVNFHNIKILKGTKFLVKISQFKFSVMTEKLFCA